MRKKIVKFYFQQRRKNFNKITKTSFPAKLKNPRNRIKPWFLGEIKKSDRRGSNPSTLLKPRIKWAFLAIRKQGVIQNVTSVIKSKKGNSAILPFFNGGRIFTFLKKVIPYKNQRCNLSPHHKNKLITIGGT